MGRIISEQPEILKKLQSRERPARPPARNSESFEVASIVRPSVRPFASDFDPGSAGASEGRGETGAYVRTTRHVRKSSRNQDFIKPISSPSSWPTCSAGTGEKMMLCT